MNDAQGRTVKRLDIRTDDTFERGGAIHFRVWCPWQAHDVPLGHCVACTGCTLVKLPCSDGEGFILCSDPDQDHHQRREPQASLAAPVFGSADRITVAAIMTRGVGTSTSSSLSIPRNTSIARVAALMASENVASLPVVGAAGEVMGFVTAKAVLGWFARSCGYILDTGGREAHVP